jgi:ribonucleotide monophosphatase NagD (HAD superfamily)
LVISPGALAFAYADLGGDTTFYGKPHPPVFQALESVFGAVRYLMVGDSMEHDIAGAQGVGWDSLLIQGGLYADRFADADGDQVIAEIAAEKRCAPPTYRIEGLR